MIPVSELVASRVRDALRASASAAGWRLDDPVVVEVERPANPAHGDYATNVAMRLARLLRRQPLEIARAIAGSVRREDLIASVETAPPGFINLRLAPAWVARQAEEIVRAGAAYGRGTTLAGRAIQVEFISANPTGPLTLANARGGPLGDVLAAVLEFCGANVQREYYVEDTGSQFDAFGRSIAIRYRELFGDRIELPPDGYPGEYVRTIAEQIRQRDGDRHRSLPLEEQARLFAPMGVAWVVEDAKRVCAKFGIRYDRWFMQSSFMASGYFQETLEELRRIGKIFERDGAVWYEPAPARSPSRQTGWDASDSGPARGSPGLAEVATTDKEGWVLVRSSGEPTYFGKDIAYHRLVLRERGIDTRIDIWGANTHYHLIRMRAAMGALGLTEDRWRVVLYQYVRFLHEGALLRMSKRHGQVVLLEDVLDGVGSDATRFFLLQRSADAQLDFDFELALQQSNDNPVYYVQYAHARIASIFRTARERGITWDDADVSLLTAPEEQELVRACLRFPDVVLEIALHYGAHVLTQYAHELAGLLHSFYRFHRVVSDDPARTRARLRLVEAVQITLRQTLGLLGISAPESM